MVPKIDERLQQAIVVLRSNVLLQHLEKWRRHSEGEGHEGVATHSYEEREEVQEPGPGVVVVEEDDEGNSSFEGFTLNLNRRKTVLGFQAPLKAYQLHRWSFDTTMESFSNLATVSPNPDTLGPGRVA